MSLKVHIFSVNFDKSQENMGALEGDRFQQDKINVEHLYQRPYNKNTLGGYIWMLDPESDL